MLCKRVLGSPVSIIRTCLSLELVSVYVELHQFIQELVSILEEVFELGILKGSAKRHKITEDEQSADSDMGNEGDNEVGLYNWRIIGVS